MSAPNSTLHPEQADFVSDKEKPSRWQVIELLIEAAEVEHMLALQYIYAASSLKIQAEVPAEFDNEKRNIYRQEMQHLHVVNQVLVGVGAEPYFGRPNFPVNWFYKEKGTDSGKIPMVLAQFDPDTLWRFLTFERGPIDQEMPELMPNFVAAYRDGKTSPLGEIPEPPFYKDLAQLYTDIMNGLTEKMFELGKKDVNDMFKETGDDAETPQLPGDRGIPKITDVATAKAALQQVIDQGEGIGAIDVNGHFQKFKSIWDAFRAELVIDEHFRPARNVMANPQLWYHSEVVDGVFEKNSTPEQKQAASENPLDIRCIHKIPDGTMAHKFSNLLCEAYEFLVIWLRQIYTHKVTCEREFHAIRQLAFLPYMSEVILPLSE
ncbi:ferritin-like-domain-containing protein, partial [Jimgerdemannia flammicorona]